MVQRSYPVVYMRGGTSRALIFHERDLPPAGAERDAIFCAALGSPDPYKRQLNGVGGGVTSLSKVAVIGPPSDPRADVDYTFGQVDVTHPVVSYRANCGNISSAVGPFAIDEGLVAAADGPARVVIHNTNTRKLIEARFGVTDGRADVDGDTVLAGVAGAGASIKLAFLEPGGAATGKLLPTGKLCETLHIAGLPKAEVSIVDAANPTVFLRAESLGLTGTEAPGALAANAQVMEYLRHIRAAAAVSAGLIAEPEDAFSKLRNLPLVCILSRARDDGAGPARITVRMLNADQPHGATPLTGAMCVAVSAHLPGTLVADMMRAPQAGEIIVEHASGTLCVNAVVAWQDGKPLAVEAVVERTARRLMDGRVYVP